MMAGTVGAASPGAVVALVKVFIRASGPGMEPSTRPQYPTSLARPGPGATGGLLAGAPELDFTDGGIRRIRAVNEVELGVEGKVAADGARGGLLHRIRTAGDLTKRRDGPRTFHDRRHHGPGSDELQQRGEEPP